MNSITHPDIASKLRALREAKKITRARAAYEMGIPYWTLVEWENTGGLKASGALKVSDYYGIPLQELLSER